MLLKPKKNEKTFLAHMDHTYFLQPDVPQIDIILSMYSPY